MLAERAATWPKQWMAEGYEKGRESGLLEGQRIAMIELVKERFGSLRSQDEERIQRATADQLRQWLKRVLTASSTDELFRG